MKLKPKVRRSLAVFMALVMCFSMVSTAVADEYYEELPEGTPLNGRYIGGVTDPERLLRRGAVELLIELANEASADGSLTDEEISEIADRVNAVYSGTIDKSAAENYYTAETFLCESKDRIEAEYACHRSSNELFKECTGEPYYEKGTGKVGFFHEFTTDYPYNAQWCTAVLCLGGYDESTGIADKIEIYERSAEKNPETDSYSWDKVEDGKYTVSLDENAGKYKYIINELPLESYCIYLGEWSDDLIYPHWGDHHMIDASKEGIIIREFCKSGNATIEDAPFFIMNGNYDVYKILGVDEDGEVEWETLKTNPDGFPDFLYCRFIDEPNYPYYGRNKWLNYWVKQKDTEGNWEYKGFGPDEILSAHKAAPHVVREILDQYSDKDCVLIDNYYYYIPMDGDWVFCDSEYGSKKDMLGPWKHLSNGTELTSDELNSLPQYVATEVPRAGFDLYIEGPYVKVYSCDAEGLRSPKGDEVSSQLPTWLFIDGKVYVKDYTVNWYYESNFAGDFWVDNSSCKYVLAQFVLDYSEGGKLAHTYPPGLSEASAGEHGTLFIESVAWGQDYKVNWYEVKEGNSIDLLKEKSRYSRTGVWVEAEKEDKEYGNLNYLPNYYLSEDVREILGGMVTAGGELILKLYFSQSVETVNLTIHYVKAEAEEAIKAAGTQEAAEAIAESNKVWNTRHRTYAKGSKYSETSPEVEIITGYGWDDEYINYGPIVEKWRLVNPEDKVVTGTLNQNTVLYVYYAQGEETSAIYYIQHIYFDEKDKRVDNGEVYEKITGHQVGEELKREAITEYKPEYKGNTYKIWKVEPAKIRLQADYEQGFIISYTLRDVAPAGYQVIHKYYRGDTEVGTVTGNVVYGTAGETINLDVSMQKPVYDGETYTYKSANVQSLTLEAGKIMQFILRYDRTTTPPSPTEDTYTLTIHYQDEAGNTLHEDYTQDELQEGDSYSQGSPAIAGYELKDKAQATVSGTMPAEDVEVTVVYKQKQQDSATYYTLTIHYQDEAGNTLHEDYTQANLQEGDSYSQGSPAIAGYELKDKAQATVSGTMPARNVVVTVVYKPGEAAQTAHYTVNHEYHLNGSLVHTEVEPLEGEVGETIYKRNLEKKDTYNGSKYTYQDDRSGPESIELLPDKARSADQVFTLVYTRTTGGGGDPTPPPPPPEEPPETPPEEPPETPPETPPVNPPETPPVNPPTLPDPNDPDSPEEITIIEDGVPKTYKKVWDPEKEEWVYIEDEDVPLADLTPKTGDDSHTALWVVLTGASLAGAVVLTMPRKKEND